MENEPTPQLLHLAFTFFSREGARFAWTVALTSRLAVVAAVLTGVGQGLLHRASG
jgi:uncharacterized membrane protein YeiH